VVCSWLWLCLLSLCQRASTRPPLPPQPKLDCLTHPHPLSQPPDRPGHVIGVTAPVFHGYFRLISPANNAHSAVDTAQQLTRRTGLVGLCCPRQQFGAYPPFSPMFFALDALLRPSTTALQTAKSAHFLQQSCLSL
jgi:hypothetical protein